MKITVVYGTDTQKARARYSQIITAIRKRGWDVVDVHPDKKIIAEKLTNPSLFGNQLFSIENANQLDAGSLTWLAKYSQKLDANVLIFHDGALPKATQDFLKKHARLENFDLPKDIWAFLDSIRPANTKAAVMLLHKVLKHEPVELVFALISGLFRDLYWVQVSPASMQINSWRKSKLSAQASKFSPEQIREIINSLAEIDINVKTSKSDLTQSLDLLLVSKLQ